jgi:hypothetical protein
VKCLEFIRGEDRPDSFGTPTPDYFDCGKVIPYPEKYAKMDAESDSHGAGFNAGGYEWCVANWGTKWGAYDTYMANRSDGEAQIEFNSAWSPPSPVVEKLAELFPTLEIELAYEEPGCDFSGFEFYSHGLPSGQASGGFDDYPISDHSWMHEDEEGEEEDANV